MKNEKIVCDYCKKQVPEQTDCMPTWFGSYVGENVRVGTICIDCIKVHRDKWRKGIFKI